MFYLSTAKKKKEMLSFIGEYSCRADNKYRVVVPSPFRKIMEAGQQEVFVLRKNIFEACIDMYPYKEWEMLVADLRGKLNLFDRTHAAFLRELYRGTQQVEMDGNGRILLPRRMLEEVGVEKEIVLAGEDTKIELWGAKAYAGIGMKGEDFAGLTQQIFGSGR